MNIIIAGDFFVSDAYKNKTLLSSCVIDQFNNADLRLVNQEAPITKNIATNKIVKTGPHLQSEAETALPFLKQLGVDVATLANNHILDYGNQGLADTFDALNKANIGYVGAGNNFEEASKAYSFEKDGVKVAILNFAENEWSTTFNEEPGANPLDIIENVKQIQKAKEAHDKVVCIIHGGHEYYQLPSPRMQKQYRFYVDNGADAVVGHHTHCISGYEVYKGGSIYYSLGNFLFTKSNTSQDWYKGLILEINIQNKQLEIKHHFISQEKETFELSILKDKELEVFENRIIEYNKIITNSNLLDKYWKEYINERY